MLHNYINGYNVAEMPACEVGKFNGATIQQNLREYDDAPDNKKELYCFHCVFAETELDNADETKLDIGFPIIPETENEKVLRKFEPDVERPLSAYSMYGCGAKLQGKGIRIGLWAFLLNDEYFSWFCGQTESVGVPTSLMFNIRDTITEKESLCKKLVADGFTNVLFVIETRGFEHDDETDTQAHNYMGKDIGTMIGSMAENAVGKTLAIIDCSSAFLLKKEEAAAIENIDTCTRAETVFDCIVGPMCNAVDPKRENRAFAKIIKCEFIDRSKERHYLAILAAHGIFRSQTWGKVDTHL